MILRSAALESMAACYAKLLAGSDYDNRIGLLKALQMSDGFNFRPGDDKTKRNSLIWD